MQDQGESVDPGGRAAQRSLPASSSELVDLLEERVRALAKRRAGGAGNARGLERKLKEQQLRVAELTKELQSMAKTRVKALKQVEGLIKQVARLEAKSEKRG